jgi:3-hydroxyisobutyrate dehydrogenase-like beta-hydroxyacid dehydrogenase
MKNDSWPRSVGVIGLGIMGSSVARHLMAAGRSVIGFDTDASHYALFSGHNFRGAETMAQLAQADVLLTSLPSEQALEATVDALLAAPRRSDQVVIELSTLSLQGKLRQFERLASFGIAMLDCPISGTGAQAAVGDLVLYVSGDAEFERRIGPVLADFSRKAIYLGAFGNGTRMKFAANLLVAIHNVAAAEAISLGLRCGLDAGTLCEVLSAGAGQSRMLELRGPMMVAGTYAPPTMKLDVWQKDMRLIKEFAAQIGAGTPMFDATIPLYQAAVTTGHGQEDTAAVRLAVDALARDPVGD